MIISDQTGYKLELKSVPKRIVSIVPSQSELIWDLGLQNELVGITRFCIHPNEMFSGVERVGGTKKLDLDKIRSLKPDLIIGNKEENEKEQIEALRKEFPVWMSDIYTLDDALEMMLAIGKIADRNEKAQQLVEGIKAAFQQIDAKAWKGKRVAYFIWYKPFMVAAKHTFIDHILERMGLVNVFGEMERYPEITPDLIKKAAPDHILLSSEPYPFGQKHMDELKQISPDSKILLVDGEMFSWYGSRLQYAPQYLKGLPL
jgi:ABC-type Fe3+-hydroxamate transport system substrate-binding protein